LWHGGGCIAPPAGASSTVFHEPPVLAFLLRLRTRIQAALRLSDIHLTLLWAAAIGLVGAGATLLFRKGIAAVQILLVGHAGALVAMGEALSPSLRMLLPALGGVAAGLILQWGRRYASHAPSSDYIEAIAIGDGRIPLRHTLVRCLSSLASIATGSSIGREGPMVQLAAMCASVVGRLRHVEPERLKLFVACGAAAGITAAYNAPIAGALFVTEIVLGSIAMERFGPLIVASVVSNVTMREFAGYQPPYMMPVFPAISGRELALFVPLGMVAGIVVPLFLQLLERSKHGWSHLSWPLPVKMGLGGLGVGVIAVWVPQVYGNGYSVVNAILHQPWLWQTLLLVLVCKIVATALVVGSGAVGGIFTPTLFVGAAFGCLYGLGVHAIWPQLSAPYAYAIVGMGASLAAATNAPLMAILMIFEMTLSYEVVLPLMLACVIAYFMSRFGGISMYDITLRREREANARLRLRMTRMVELIQPTQTVLGLDAGVKEMTRLFLEYPVKYLYVVDAEQRFCGVVALARLTSAMLAKEDLERRSAADLVQQPEFACLTPDMSLDEALQCFVAHQGERLPVVAGADNHFIGVVFKSSLLDAYFKMSAVA
jgi:chloride channel protein, CIC family